MRNLVLAPSDSTTAFELFRNRIGRWCARRVDGLVFGTFFEREAAIHFARRECRDAKSLRLIDPAADSA
jgi:hypothetical protein